MEEVVGYVVGIANLLEDDNMRLLRTIDADERLRDAFGTETIQILIEYHWKDLGCFAWTGLCFVLHCMIFVTFSIWSSSVTRESQLFNTGECSTREKGACSRVFYKHDDNGDLLEKSVEYQAAGCFVFLHVVWLFWKECRLFHAHWAFDCTKEHEEMQMDRNL